MRILDPISDLLKWKCLGLTYQLPSPLAQLVAGREPGILLYHGVPRKTERPGKYAFDGAAFERQVVHLKDHFDLIRPEDCFKVRSWHMRKAVLLTFDDGFQNNALVVAPILRKHNVPAVFFACNRHVQSANILWFAYLNALRYHYPHNGFTFRGEYFAMKPSERESAVSRLMNLLLELKPHPSAMYSAIENELPRVEAFVERQELADWYSGMTEEQLAELGTDDLFSVQAHTLDHPFLTRCEPEEIRRQLVENKTFLERVCGKAVISIAYPSGDYNQTVIDECIRQGFRTGFAVTPKVLKHSTFEIPRAGVYQSAQEIAAFKAMWARRREDKG